MLTRLTNLFSGGKKQKLASWLLTWVLPTWWLALVLGVQALASGFGAGVCVGNQPVL